MAPKLLGHEAMPLVKLPGLEKLDEHIALAFDDVVKFDSDLRLNISITDFARNEYEF
jgi:riboflavin biosynthesis pyrimidine reductase